MTTIRFTSSMTHAKCNNEMYMTLTYFLIEQTVHTGRRMVVLPVQACQASGGTSCCVESLPHAHLPLHSTSSGFSQTQQPRFKQATSSVTGQLVDTPTRGLPTRGLDDSRTRHLVDWSTRGLDNSRTGQVTDWTTRGCHRRLLRA